MLISILLEHSADPSLRSGVKRETGCGGKASDHSHGSKRGTHEGLAASQELLPGISDRVKGLSWALRTA
jgi:hypothetical protein